MIFCEVGPGTLEKFKILFKTRDHIVFIEVICLKLLNDHQNEQVKHDESTKHHQWNEEDWRPRVATVLSINTAIFLCFHRIFHYVIPVLPSRHSYNNQERHTKVTEVKMITNDKTF